jgi:uncharacterized protein YdhG (YjbR/CyaY superfamily)
MDEVNKYLKSLDELHRNELERVRVTISNAAPEALEFISYGMPGFRYKDKYLVTYGAFKNHFSIFPGSSAIEAFKKQLAPYKLSKGTIQFTLDKPITNAIIVDIIKFCIQRIDKEVE